MKILLALLATLSMVFSGSAQADLALADFGNVAVGSSSVQNVAGHGWVAGPADNCTFQISAMSLTGQDMGDFTASTQCVGITMGHGDSCYGPLSFHPSSVGAKNATLNLQLTISGTYATGASCQWSGGGSVVTISRPLTGVGISAASLSVFDPLAGVPATLPPVVQSVTPNGTASSLSLSARMRFDAAMAGQQGKIFVGAHVGPYATAIGLPGVQQPRSSMGNRVPQDAAADSWYIREGASWSGLGATIPSDFTGTLNDASAMINILNGANAAALCGTEFYVGYGSSSDAMLANNTLGKVYTVMCNYTFAGSASGNSSGLTLLANLQVATLDAGRQGNFYVGKLLNGQWQLYTGSGWVPYTGGALPVYASGPLASRSIQVFSNANLSGESGAQIYVGYGLSDDDLLNNHKYGPIHTVQ